MCDPGYDRDDCSRGDGMASVSLIQPRFGSDIVTMSHVNVTFERSEETFGLLTDLDWVGIYKKNDAIECDTPTDFAYAVGEREATDNPYLHDVVYNVPQKRASGTVTLKTPWEPGTFVVRY